MDNNNYVINQIGPCGKKIKEIIIQGDDFIVYLDEKEDIRWSTESSYGTFPPQFGSIQNRVSYWESICNKIFKRRNAFDYKCLLAEAYARILDDKNIELSNDIIELASKRIEKHGKEVLKQHYILSSFYCTVLTLSLIVLIALSKNWLIQYLSHDEYQIIITSLFGGIGAFVFATLRLKEYSPDLAISIHIHRVDGALRIFYGLISGLIIIIGIKSNMVLGFINITHNKIYTGIFLGIMAGSSEILIPNLIKQIEGKTSDKVKTHE